MGRAPTIGITVSIDASGRLRRRGRWDGPEPEVLFVRRSYAQAVRAAGGLPLLVPPDADPAEAVRVCDGFVISGGGDLPAALGAVDGAGGVLENTERIDWDRRLLDRARAARRPMLGVCYGMQLLNLHYGGTLLLDIAECVTGALDHGGGGRASEHPIAIREDSLLRVALGAEANVCSRHHQAVERIAPGFREAAAAPDGVIEAIEAEGVLGVEWHPESDATGPAVYGWLLDRAREGT